MSTIPAEQIKPGGDLDQLRLEVAQLQSPIGNEGPALENIADRLQGILETTETSCEKILQSIESVLEISKNIRASAPDCEAVAPACDALEEQAISALESCAFQDLTSQRVSMIVRDLLHVETSVEAITDTLGREDIEKLTNELSDKNGNGGDADPFLHGPQNEKDAFDQGEIDAVFT